MLALHPHNILVRGSTKIGFSIAPKPESLWRAYGPKSDIDLAIIDNAFFERMDHEVRAWEREPANAQRLFKDREELKKYRSRCLHKGKFDCYRHFDLPDIPTRTSMLECFRRAPLKECCDRHRPLDAFVFKDWWGLWRRYEFDLSCIITGKGADGEDLPTPTGTPRPRIDDEAHPSRLRRALAGVRHLLIDMKRAIQEGQP